MFEHRQYQLLDFGNGRKLERFGAHVLDRPSPAAEDAAITQPALWGSATARFDMARGGKGAWSGQLATEASWPIAHGDTQLVMQLSASGNVGVFPEQADNWNWIAARVRERCALSAAVRPRVLNLFAYTGGASLAAAVAGADVTHVDSSGPTVAWAKRNAEASGLAELPVRWLVEDAMKFVARELRRGNRYDGIIADPPTYGHGPKGKPFKFRQHLSELLGQCGELLAQDGFLVFSCHAPGFGSVEAMEAVASALPDVEVERIEGQQLVLESADGRLLEAGVAARWTR